MKIAIMVKRPACGCIKIFEKGIEKLWRNKTKI